MYRAVIFDLDGTLLNTIGDLAAAANHTLAEMGFAPHTEEEYKYMVGNGIPKLIERFLPPGHRDEAAQAQAARLFFPYYDAHKEDATAPYPGIPALLAALHGAGVKLGVVSNKEDALTKSVVSHYFPGLFDAVAGHTLGTPTKPDPHLVNGMRAAFGLSAQQVLYVGDSGVDIETARNAGLAGCGVLWGFRSRQELEQEGADYLASTPEDLLTLILGEKGGRETRHLGPEDVEEEVKILAEEGYKEIVLTGIHLTSYGIDFKDEGIDFLTLIKRLHEIDGIERIRFGSLEPRVITEEFASELSRLPKICPHFHLSLQSGCDDTLKRMNRHYTTEEYAAGCEILRRYFDNPAITTDVIVGFPGETEEEFEETKAFLERIGFYEMHIFKYSRRAGTRADRMPEQVPEQVKSVRSEVLLKLEKQMSKAYRESFSGKKKTVLLEEKTEIGGRAYMIGHTMEYVKAVVPYADNLKNKMTEGILKEALNDEVLLLDSRNFLN